MERQMSAAPISLCLAALFSAAAPALAQPVDPCSPAVLGSLPTDTFIRGLAVDSLDGVTTLERLSLHGHRLQREGTVQAIAACVARQTCLARLDLSDTALSEHLETLCKALCKNNRVKSVCLANNDLDVGSVWSVAVFTRATELDLSRNALFNTEFWIKLRFYSLLPQLRSLCRLWLVQQ